MSAAELDHSFDVFGTRARLLVIPGTPDAATRIATLERRLRDMHELLTRFEPRSELNRLNADPRTVVPVSDELGQAAAAALDVARASGGLVDPTLEPEVVAAGYATTFRNREPAPLKAALSSAPRRRPARPDQTARWQQVLTAPGTLSRPPGLRLDLGGSAKGLAADLCAATLAGQHAYAVDLGGDVRIGGTARVQRLVTVEHPFTGDPAHGFAIADGAVATSGIARRTWAVSGGFAHHLIDPSTGRPAWTGVVQATALAPTALEAEMLAKLALLSGPTRGIEILERHGGVLIADSGEIFVAFRRETTEAVAA
jgi:thiamine biosynthesis lipoprotein